MEKENISDFLKLAYKSGRVKDASEAFKVFDPAEEVHKGDPNYFSYLKENEEIYNLYKVGDIVFVKEYVYSNGEIGKNHSFVIIEQNNLAVPIENMGMLLLSKLEKIKYKQNKILKKDERNGLNMDSIIKTDVIYILKNEQILFKIGEVDMEKVEEYRQAFIENI